VLLLTYFRSSKADQCRVEPQFRLLICYCLQSDLLERYQILKKTTKRERGKMIIVLRESSPFLMCVYDSYYYANSTWMYTKEVEEEIIHE
jgi:hypothetical protein